MSLDIEAHSRLLKTQNRQGIHLSVQPSEFLDRTDGLERGPWSAGSTMRFRAGSYSGYNNWREQLAEMAGYPKALHRSGYGKPPEELHAAGAWEANGGPFWELINFSDCEGYIGPKTSAKLAKDFAEFQAQADAHPDSYFRQLYREWRSAFELASDGGAVDFS